MLSGYPVVVEVVVRWREMDSLGHVNNIMYLQYFEIARIAYLQRLGLEPPSLNWGERGLIMAALTCRFKTPVTFPDTLSVGSRVAAVGEDRVIMEHVAVSHKLGRVAAVGDDEIVSYDYVEGRRAPMPLEWRRKMVELEGHELAVLPPRKK